VPQPPTPPTDAERLRRLVLVLLLAGMLGTATELLLLDHTEKRWQWVPFAALGAGVASGLALVVRPRPALLRSFQAAMALFLAAGLAGLWLHYRGNVEFELEMRPALTGSELAWRALKGATPALAPLALAHLGLLGLACTYRHPVRRPRPAAAGQEEQR